MARKDKPVNPLFIKPKNTADHIKKVKAGIRFHMYYKLKGAKHIQDLDDKIADLQRERDETERLMNDSPKAIEALKSRLKELEIQLEDEAAEKVIRPTKNKFNRTVQKLLEIHKQLDGDLSQLQLSAEDLALITKAIEMTDTSSVAEGNH